MKLKTFYFISTIILLGIFCCSNFAYAAKPVIFYSDLTSGPNTGGQENKGAFVTISGKNFGTTRGTSYVSIGGGQADNYPIWSDTKITFQVGANVATGDIKITAGEGQSNGVSFTVRSGNIYFVDSDEDIYSESWAESGSGTYTNPWKSPLSFVDNAVAGDICYFRAGIYVRRYGHNNHYNFGIGSGEPQGTSGNEVAYIAYPGESVTIDADGNLSGGQTMEGCFDFDVKDYCVVSGFTLDGDNRGGVRVAGDYIRIINNDIIGRTSTYSTIKVDGSDYTYVYGNILRGLTSENKLTHALYPGYGTDNLDFGWNHIRDNQISVGPAISVNQDNADVNGYVFDNILIHDNIIDCTGSTENGGNPTGLRAIGFVAQADESTAKVYNNIIISGGAGSVSDNCLYVYSGSVDICNNTFYNSQLYDADNSYVIQTKQVIDGLNTYTPETVNIKNNIITTEDTSGFLNSPLYVYSDGTGTVAINANCYYGNGSAVDTNAVNSNPLFMDPANYDFRLQAGSPCKDQGFDTSAIVLTDINGIPRPQNSIVDIGAYEYSVASSDYTAPDAITNLSALTGDNEGQVKLSWTATGDDGSSGTAAAYMIKYSSSIITSDAEFYQSSDVSGEPVPSVAGSSESMTVSGLTGGQTYYFAIKVRDEAPNTSALSNVPSAVAKAAGAVVDNTSPYESELIPSKSAIAIQPDANIVVHVKDDGAGVDINTIVMKVNGVTVTPVITGTPADYTLTYDPPNNFNTGDSVTVTVDASDLAN